MKSSFIWHYKLTYSEDVVPLTVRLINEFLSMYSPCTLSYTILHWSLNFLYDPLRWCNSQLQLFCVRWPYAHQIFPMAQSYVLFFYMYQTEWGYQIYAQHSIMKQWKYWTYSRISKQLLAALGLSNAVNPNDFVLISQIWQIFPFPGRNSLVLKNLF